MSIENILFQAEELGKRQKVIEGVSELQSLHVSLSLEEIYEVVWQEVRTGMRT